MPVEKQRMFLLHDQKIPASRREGAYYMSEINCALVKVGAPDWIDLWEVRKNEKGSITAIAAERCTIGNLRRYEDIIIRAARVIDCGIIGFEEIEVWKKLKIHRIPLTRYVRRGTNGLEKLREEIEAENAGVSVPMAARWLVNVPQIKERWAKGLIQALSVFLAVRGEDTARKLLKEGIRICGNRYTIKRYQEERPNTQCTNCAKWGT
jgi:hypothetical protein